MKRLLTATLILGYLSFALAQGVQGNVTLNGKVTVSTTGHSVTLNWTASPGATSYNMYRGTTSGGPYTEIAMGIATTTYYDTQVTHGQTLYYVTTGVSGGNESGYSNEVAAVIP